MEELSRKEEILMFTHKGQHEESLQHRRTILNAFTLSMTGLMVILGGIISGGHQIPCELRLWIECIIFLVCFTVVYFMKRQRHLSQEAMNIMRKAERELKLCQEGVYLSNESVLPPSYCKGLKTFWGLTGGDCLQASALIIFGLLIIIVLRVLPNCS